MFDIQIAWDQFEYRIFAQTPHNDRIQISPKIVIAIFKKRWVFYVKEKMKEIRDNCRTYEEIWGNMKAIRGKMKDIRWNLK